MEKRSLAACRAEFPALARLVDGKALTYLDGPAGTQVPQAVIDAIAAYYTTCNANTHGAFITSQESDHLIEQTRRAMADFLGAEDARSISFGANMTTLAFALARAVGRALAPGDEIVITQLDHEANRGPWLGLTRQGIVVREIRVRRDGTLDPESMAEAITPATRLVAIGHASNALGTVNDLGLARRLSQAAGAWLLVDAVHSAPHLSLDVGEIDPDFLLCSAYKFYGPHVGILYSRPGLLDTLEPDRLRTQEQAAPTRIETGTLNHAALAGVLAAVEFIASFGTGGTRRARMVSAMSSIAHHERTLARRYWEQVQQIPGVEVWGPGFDDGPRAPTVSITLAGLRADEVARRLARDGIQVWDGDFYAARVVEILGLVDRGGLIRTGMSMYTDDGDVTRLLDALRGIAGR